MSDVLRWFKTFLLILGFLLAMVLVPAAVVLAAGWALKTWGVLGGIGIAFVGMAAIGACMSHDL